MAAINDGSEKIGDRRTCIHAQRAAQIRVSSSLKRPCPLFSGVPNPAFFAWTTSFKEVWRDGYGHHITRLMVISNWSMLLGLNPRDVTDWFWVAYIDAYDWVVEPNVLGMGTFATGDLMITKPYVSGSAYVNKMSDFCSSCAFHPKKNCPMTSMYWHFLHENKAKLEHNPRLKLVMASSRKRSDSQKELDRSVAQKVRTTLQAGAKLTPRKPRRDRVSDGYSTRLV